MTARRRSAPRRPENLFWPGSRMTSALSTANRRAGLDGLALCYGLYRDLLAYQCRKHGVAVVAYYLRRNRR